MLKSIFVFICINISVYSFAQGPADLAKLLAALEENIVWEAVSPEWESERESWLVKLSAIQKMNHYEGSVEFSNLICTLIKNTKNTAFKTAVDLKQLQNDVRIQRMRFGKLVLSLINYEASLSGTSFSGEWASKREDWLKTARNFEEKSRYNSNTDESICLDFREIMDNTPKRFETFKENVIKNQQACWTSNFQIYGTRKNYIKTVYNSSKSPLYTEFVALVTIDKDEFGRPVNVNSGTIQQKKWELEFKLDKCDNSFFQKTISREGGKSSWTNFTDNPDEISEFKEFDTEFVWKNKEFKTQLKFETMTVLDDETDKITENLYIIWRVDY